MNDDGSFKRFSCVLVEVPIAIDHLVISFQFSNSHEICSHATNTLVLLSWLGLSLKLGVTCPLYVLLMFQREEKGEGARGFVETIRYFTVEQSDDHRK